MKSVIAIAVLSLVPSSLCASDPSGERRFETQSERIVAVRDSMRAMKPGMERDDVRRLLPKHGLVLEGMPSTFRHQMEFYKVERGVELVLSFTDFKLTGARLERGDKVIARVGK